MPSLVEQGLVEKVQVLRGHGVVSKAAVRARKAQQRLGNPVSEANAENADIDLDLPNGVKQQYRWRIIPESLRRHVDVKTALVGEVFKRHGQHDSYDYPDSSRRRAGSHSDLRTRPSSRSNTASYTQPHDSYVRGAPTPNLHAQGQSKFDPPERSQDRSDHYVSKSTSRSGPDVTSEVAAPPTYTSLYWDEQGQIVGRATADYYKRT